MAPCRNLSTPRLRLRKLRDMPQGRHQPSEGSLTSTNVIKNLKKIPETSSIICLVIKQLPKGVGPSCVWGEAP